MFTDKVPPCVECLCKPICKHKSLLSLIQDCYWVFSFLMPEFGYSDREGERIHPDGTRKLRIVQECLGMKHES